MQVDCLQCNNNNVLLHCNVLATLIKIKKHPSAPCKSSLGEKCLVMSCKVKAGTEAKWPMWLQRRWVQSRTQAQLGFSEISVELLQFLYDSLPMNNNSYPDIFGEEGGVKSGLYDNDIVMTNKNLSLFSFSPITLFRFLLQDLMSVVPTVPHRTWLRQNWSGRCPPQQEGSGPGGTTHLHCPHSPPTVINNHFPVLLMLAGLKAALAPNLSSFKSQVTSAATSKQEGHSPRKIRLFLVEFACSPCVCTVDSHCPKICTWKLSIGLFVFLRGLVINWQLVRGVTCYHLKTAETDSSNTRDPECRRSVDRRMEVRCSKRNLACLLFVNFCQNRQTTLRLFHTVTLCYTFEGSEHIAQSILEHRIEKSRMVIGKHYFLLACWTIGCQAMWETQYPLQA